MSAGVTVKNPFPGLRPFEAKDSTLFFGRDEQIGEALDRMLRQRLLAVVGVSGCGKSSLVGAGMVPTLEMGLAGDPQQRWRIATMRPGDGPLRELGRCLGFGDGALAERSYGLLEAVETHLPAGDNLLLVVDQFEEIFPFRDRKLREGAGSEADLFVSYLLRAAQDPAGRVYALLTMRSDYLGECAKFHGLPEALNDGQYLVPRMTRQQLLEAIEGPLTAAGVEIHPALVQNLLNQCDEEPDNLPLLQHLLRRMFEQWEGDGGRGLITAATAAKVGGLSEALDRDAETVCRGLSPEEQRIAEVLFRRITESRQADRDDDDRPVRRPQTVVDLARLAVISEDLLRDVVRRFEQRGLLMVRKTDQGDKVDLPHECLCVKWQRLKDWIRSEAEDAKKLRFLMDAVGKGYLTGLALSEALEWKTNGRLDTEWGLRYLTGEQVSSVVAWVTESQRLVEEAAEKERQRQEEKRKQAEERTRRAKITATILAVAFLLAAAIGIYAFSQKGEAERQRAEAKKQEDLAKTSANDANAQRKIAEENAQGEKKQREAAEEQKTLADAARTEAEYQATLASSRQLATAALLNKDIHLDLAALLGVKAWRVADTFEARDSLLSSLEASPGLISIMKNRASVVSVALSPDGKIVACANADGTLRLWDVITHQPLGEPLKHPSGLVMGVAFSPDGTLLASAGFNVQLWDVASRRQSGGPLKTTGAHGVAFSPDGKLLATAGQGDDEAVRLWDVAGRQQVGEPLTGHSAVVDRLGFSLNGNLLASSGYDGVILWDVAKHQRATGPLKVSPNSNSIAFSPDGKTLAVGTELWDVTTQEPAGGVGDCHGYAQSVAFSPDGKLLASACGDETIRLWNVARRAQVGEPLTGHSLSVVGVAFSPDGGTLVSASEDQTVRLWEVAPHPRLSVLLTGHTGQVYDVAFSPDGKLLASAGSDRTVELWNVVTRQAQGALKGHIDAVKDIAFSPDGKLLASASQDKTVRLWDVATHQPSSGGTLVGHSDALTGIAFSPNGKLLVSASRFQAILWDLASRRAVGESLRGGWSVAFSPAGKLLASTDGANAVVLWDIDSRPPHQLGQPLRGHSNVVTSVAFSPDGKLLASGSYDRTVQFWDVVRGKPLGDPLRGYMGYVMGVAFSRDGKTLATASWDGTVRLWDVATRQLLGGPLNGNGLVNSVAFAPNGKLLASAGGNGTVTLWDVDPSSWAARLCHIANRNLSMAEWRQYIGPREPYRRTCPDLPPGEGAPAI